MRYRNSKRTLLTTMFTKGKKIKTWHIMWATISDKKYGSTMIIRSSDHKTCLELKEEIQYLTKIWWHDRWENVYEYKSDSISFFPAHNVATKLCGFPHPNNEAEVNEEELAFVLGKITREHHHMKPALSPDLYYLFIKNQVLNSMPLILAIAVPMPCLKAKHLDSDPYQSGEAPN